MPGTADRFEAEVRGLWYLSDVLAGYAIGLGWGFLVEAYHRRHPPWAVLPMSDGRTMVGLAFHWRWD